VSGVPAGEQTWLSRHRRPEQATPRLVAYTVPPIGASPAVHRELAQTIDGDIDVFTLRLPGRESRRDEAPLSGMAGCVADLAPRLAAHAAAQGLPFVLVGDCATSLLAYELTRAIEDSAAVPAAVVAIAGRSPRYGYRDCKSHLATTEQLRIDVTASGLMPREITDDPEVFALFEAAVRADLAVYETYRWDGHPLRQVPVFALVPETLGDDPRFTSWREASRRPTRLVPIDDAARTSAQITTAIAPPAELAGVLAQLRDSAVVADPAGVEPSTTRAAVVAAWTGLLPDAHGADDEHFLEVGGDSLLAVRLRNTLREQVGRSPALELILRGLTLGELVTHMDRES
jgi:medium-chain acyl-[acyl-carrier-protein] hydrolase